MKNVLFYSLLLYVSTMSACKTTKQKTAGPESTALTGTYWRLTEINGKPIGPTPADKREIHIKLNKEASTMEGFAGCNGIGGNFEVKEGSRISFTKVIGTMMACPDLDTENSLLEILRSVDNYNLVDKQLVLNRARMAPLARFEAVDFK
ncbi:META domain-containing protein [Dyadobacter sp. NIV53]|uniref:META domain-containing protein n=1 Tax=Dyadobacter sp. NIV53 TaxID=2861765 RepID=UPI001C86CD9E|nr:META domain-containing protein [Dyadobacter sp. NIV53]